MKIKKIALILRQNGFFHHVNGEKIKAVYPKQGYAVMVFFEDSPIDTDFNEKVWVPSAEELEEIRRKLDLSDKKSMNC